MDLKSIGQGLERGEFFLEYLPCVSLLNGRCIGAEALIRWRRDGGIVPPHDFIPLTSNTILSGPITYWVLETVTTELGDWLTANPDQHIGINVPPEIVGRGAMTYVADKMGLLRNLSQVLVEVSARGIPERLAVAAIKTVQEFGARIALDNVTLARDGILMIPAGVNFDAIKFDKSLIDAVGDPGAEPYWLRAIAALPESSHPLRIAVGVETEQQATTLRHAKISAAQGLHFSQPVTADALMAFARAYGNDTQP